MEAKASIYTSLPDVTRPEISEIFIRYGDEFLARYPQPAAHLRAIHLIKICRTEKLGGHLEKCDLCEYRRLVYHSCRSRMCPKCQSLKKERWIEARKKELLPCPYFHGVFTIPHSLNEIAQWNKKLLCRFLFEAVSETLQTFSNETLGGQIGFIGVLHTWNQKLLDHIHLHCIIPGGAVNVEKARWTPVPAKSFLFPVHALSRVFKAKYIEKLRGAHAEIQWPWSMEYLKRPENFSDFLDSLWEKEWVVYAKAPFQGPEAVIEYLGRYTHKTAISNRRILKIEEGLVSFKYRDRTDGDQEKIQDIDAVEFMRRFMLHTLPKGFQRIRHFGFLANKTKRARVTLIFELLQRPRPKVDADLPLTARDFILRAFGLDISKCPHCKKGALNLYPLLARPP